MTSERADELLYDSDRTRVSRVRLADGKLVVRKQPLGGGAAGRLRNEIAVLRRLESLDGTPTLAGDGAGGVLELVDTGARTLADLEMPWATDALLELGLSLAEVLAGIHRRGVVHRDVSPANVLVDAVTRRPMLIDFELATLPGAHAAEAKPGPGGVRAGKARTGVAGLHPGGGKTGVAGPRTGAETTGAAGTRAGDGKTVVLGTPGDEGRTGVPATRAGDATTGVTGTRAGDATTRVTGTRAGDGKTEATGTRAGDGKTGPNGPIGTRSGEGNTRPAGTMPDAGAIEGTTGIAAGRAGEGQSGQVGARAADSKSGLVGTLPYLAPEQTGRTGCAVDHRSDLYSLGATLYELATGRPPFGRDRDPLSLIHDHLATVPDAPSEVNPLVPALLSEIILRLLSKEPELRYQSGEGLAYDLAQLRAGRLTVLGERDFPIHLAPPARLIGRDAPLATLHTLLAGTADGSALALVTGPPGVGKTALVDRLRPAVAEAGGRFVAGKFDQFHHDAGGGAVREAFDRLGEQLLAEPEEVVVELRARLREALGADAGLIAALMPPFRAVLDVAPEHDVDPRVFLARLRRAGMTLLRTVADGAPLVFFLDDLQWASGAAFSYLDDVLDNPDVPGLLVLGAYREEEVDEAHPLTAVLARLRRERGDAGEVRLDNLSVGDLGVLIAEMLRLPEADRLAEVLAERTDGNPFDTVELLSALRREGVLVPDGGGWRWDATAVRDFVGHGDVLAMLTARIAALPTRTRAAVDMMACLGGDVPLELLAAPLTAAVDDGLVVVDGDTARFRHDRVQQAAYSRLRPDERARLSLSLARRLAPAPEAAPLYLAAADLLVVPGASAPGERRTAASMLRASAAAARLVANHASAEACLAVAARLLHKTDEGYAETRAAWHASLCALGRFGDADRVFADLAATTGDPVRLAGPVAEQLGALTTRRMLAEALELGLSTLSTLGIDVPSGPAEMAPRISAGMDRFYGWLATAGDTERPEITDPRILAAAHVIDRLTAAAFFADRVTMAWLVAQAAELWARHGVCAALTGTLGNIGVVTIAGSGDHEAAYRATAHVLAIGVEHGHELATAQVRFLHALATVPWYEPLENGVRMAHEARDGLLRGGDLRTAFYTYFASLPQILDLSEDLEPFLREMRAAEAFAERIGAGPDAALFTTVDMLVQTLRGTGDFDDTVVEALAGNDTAYAFATTMRALLAAVLGDDEALVRFSAESMRVLPALPGNYLTAPAHLLAALAAAVSARTGQDREEALATLDRSHDFLAARAAGQPANFRHLYRLAEATRAAAHGDVAAAAAAYDEAMSDAATAGRSWHTPLITELAARFYLDHGMEHVGARLLAEALPGYARWGAVAKVHAMKRAHPALGSALGSATPGRSATLGGASVNLSNEVIDLMAVLEAARALSSETSVDLLRIRVQQVLGAMTGATAVHVVLHDDRAGCWVLPGDGDRPDLTAEEAAERGLLPLAAIRYAERTREPMLVDDVSLDDRVGRDPYLAGLEHCSLLVVPVIGQGQPRAVLVLENRLSRRAFSAGRLDAVLLIAGQLTVSLENAQVYASLERAVAERTEELAEANLRLELLAVTDPLTGLPNRRKLTTFLEEAWLRAERSGEPIGVAMIDIDNFKKYNDHYGHQGGDECLRLVADALRVQVRSTDLVARYGGEEFCIVMPGATAANAKVVAERACRAVAGLQQPHALADDGTVTVSVGVTAGTPLTHADPDQLHKLADEALYEAKRAGRNRVVAG
ncbi:hypothetical protein Aph02nite_42050 [Actinoplanes philippinensis]|uniref:Diguanylate cyclase (GGDEF) domain-containing protein n=1 Tax=Actinoplanes philippinensis TaxID=35752 RepID=A0A1I2H0S8_9ACTN|nr:diguanylate cyclase [Actinoplanes philippinensis]GIE78255.1 hypothetical protein Aph02nite_42050 [Actinoplanes philippinensis]SFF22899.1 diguanylate cyclase (GGDEF) domain-containing protein [Actinoplanes philippinensis]